MTGPNERLADVATIIMGTSPKGDTYNEAGEGMPLLNGPTEFGPSFPTCTLYTTDSKKECRPGDLIFCVRGSTTGRMNWADKVYSLGRGVCAIRGETRLDTKYIRYCIDLRLEALLKQAGGGTFPNLTQDSIRDFQIPYLASRHKIAAILSTYDDLIENNTRRIAILEAMAQAIYRAWFLEFRFPGHEKVKVVDSPTGKIPEGWVITPLKAITSKIGSGSTPRGGKEAYKVTGITLIRSLNVYDNRFELNNLAFIDDDQAAQLDNVTIEKRDILLNITGASVARCCMVPTYLLPARVNQHVAIIRVDAKVSNGFYVLNTINSDKHKRQLLALAQGGATREALTKDTISNYEIVLPPRKILTQYEDIVTGLFDQRELLERKNNCLRTTRDLLLPKLISGQLDVEDLDIDTAETVTE